MERSKQISSCEKFRNGVLVSNEQKVDIFVHGLHPLTSIQEIIELFSPFVNLKEPDFEKSQQFIKNKGFAFFSVDSKEAAHKLINTRHNLNGRIIHCDYKQNDPEKQLASKRRRVFIGGLPRSATDDQLIHFFSQYGYVRAAYSIKDSRGRSKCFGYVDFRDEDSAFRLISQGRVFFKMGENDIGRYIEVKMYQDRSGKNSKSRERNSRFGGKLRKSNHEIEPLLSTKSPTFEVEDHSSSSFPESINFSFSRPQPTPFDCLMNRKGEMLEYLTRCAYEFMLNGNYSMAEKLFLDVHQMKVGMFQEGYMKEFLGQRAL